jgi:hypothetical protein
MLRRRDVRAHDVDVLMAALNYVFNLMGFDSKFRGRRFGRSLRLYVKALCKGFSFEGDFKVC